MTNLTTHTLPQLRQLSAKIEKEIAKRQSASKTDLLKRLTKMARESGLSLDDVLGRATPAPAKAPKVASKSIVARKEPLPAKYRHPNNKDLAWSGRGRRPRWVDAWVANGGALEALEIAAQKLAKKVARKAAVTEQPAAPEAQGETVAAE
jgi:DNA-binding protein H-NS